MFIESFKPFRIQHVRGNDRTQLVADGLSRLHVANLALSKTLDECDAEAEFLAEQAEGGMDEAMFESHIGKVAHAWGKIACTAANGEFQHARMLSRDDRRQEAERRERYGRGCDLLTIMGWRISDERHRKMEWEVDDYTPATSSKRRRGLGYRARPAEKATLTTTPRALNVHEDTQTILGECHYLGTFSEGGQQQQAEQGKSLHIPNRQGGRKQSQMKTTTINPHESGVTNLIDTTCNTDITSKRIRGRHDKTSPVQRAAAWEDQTLGERGDPRRALSAIGTCNPVIETQTNTEDFRQAGRKWRGGFPDADLIKTCHDDTHPSFPTTWKRLVRATGIGPGAEQAKLKEQVRYFCDACLTCQKLQPARKRVAARIGSIKTRPFGEIAFDVIVLNTPDEDDNRYILTVIDNYSHAVELFPIKRASAEAATTCLHDVLCRYGRPHQVRYDNAKAFAAQVTKQLLQRARVKQNFCPTYSHNSNGQVENATRRVMEVLRAMILDDRLGANTHLRWSLLLPAVRRVIMTRTILQYGCCPNDLCYVISPENESSIFEEEIGMPPLQQEPMTAGDPGLIDTLQRQHAILLDACERKLDEHLEKLAALHQRQADDIEPLIPGDFVLVDMRERPHTKISSPWSGPWQVIEKEDNDDAHPIMMLQHMASKKIDRFHASMCKRCNLDLFEEVDDSIKWAASDNFEYEIEAVLDHRPRGECKHKRRDAYEFQALCPSRSSTWSYICERRTGVALR
jgi:hypothetical protein